MRFSSVLQTIVVWNLVQLSSSLSDECEFYTNQRQGKLCRSLFWAFAWTVLCPSLKFLNPDVGLMPIQINCTIFLNGTLNIWWNLTNQHVDKVVSIDYNCTGIGDEQVHSLMRKWTYLLQILKLPSLTAEILIQISSVCILSLSETAWMYKTYTIVVFFQKNCHVCMCKYITFDTHPMFLSKRYGLINSIHEAVSLNLEMERWGNSLWCLFLSNHPPSNIFL